MANKKVVALGATAATGVVGAIAVDGINIPLNIGEIGGWGLLCVVVGFGFFALVKGWVIVKLHYDTILARAEAAELANVKLSERAAILTDTNSVQARTIEKQTAAADTTIKIMGAIQDARINAGGSQ